MIHLIPFALILGLIALLGFLWALRTGQFDDEADIPDQNQETETKE